MPNWQPNWNDVVFDHARAQAAIDALRSTADLLDTQTDQRVRLAARAQEQWLGNARLVFDGELNRMTRQAADLSAALRSAARSIEAAADEARLEQRRRVDARNRWYQEKRVEDAAAAREADRAGSGVVGPRPR